jgi:hypothetical protein
MAEQTNLEVAVPPSRSQSRIPFAPAQAFEAIKPDDPSYVKAVVDYCCQPFPTRERQVMQVYEELLNFAYWLRGFAPHNILEIGTAGATFFVMSRLATGKKVAIDIRDLRSRLHHFMFGHDWCFFHGDSHSSDVQRRVREYCDGFDLIFIDGDHRYDGVRADFEDYRRLLSSRGVIVFHDVDPDHAFKGAAGGEAARFWAELDVGTKTMLHCSRSNGRIEFLGETEHFGGIGIWSPQ